MSKARQDIKIKLLLERIGKIMAEVNCLHFLPSTNITLDPHRNTGNFHSHITNITDRVGRLIAARKSRSQFFSRFLLPAACLKIAGTNNCEVLAAYVYIRLLEEANLDNLEEIPALFRFDDDKAGKGLHFSVALNIGFDETQLKQGILYPDTNFARVLLIDPWLREFGKFSSIESAIHKRYPNSTSGHYNGPVGANSIDALKRIQATLRKDFEAACLEFKAVFEQELIDYPMATAANATRVGEKLFSVPTSKTELGFLTSTYLIDPEAAHADLQKCHTRALEDDLANRLQVPENIKRVWGYLLRNDQTLLKKVSLDKNPIILELLAKVDKDMMQEKEKKSQSAVSGHKAFVPLDFLRKGASAQQILMLFQNVIQAQRIASEPQLSTAKKAAAEVDAQATTSQASDPKKKAKKKKKKNVQKKVFA